MIQAQDDQMSSISRAELERKVERRDPFALVEVSDRSAYREAHLPRALNVPLDENFEEGIQRAVPDRQLEVIVYADRKHRLAYAARRLMEQLGYEHVREYPGGKQDWFAHSRLAPDGPGAR